MEKYLEGSWKEFEQWIRFTIGSDFRWRVRPMDKLNNRQLVVEQLAQRYQAEQRCFPVAKFIYRNKTKGPQVKKIERLITHLPDSPRSFVNNHSPRSRLRTSNINLPYQEKNQNSTLNGVRKRIIGTDFMLPIQAVLGGIMASCTFGGIFLAP